MPIATAPAKDPRLNIASIREPKSTFNVALAVGGAIALGIATALSPEYTVGVCAFLALAIALLRSPALGILAVLAIAGVLGRSGARILIAGVPLLELLLLLTGLAATVKILADRPGHSRGFVVWLLPTIWGLVLLLLRNHGDQLSGLREALIFLYPVTFVLPLMTVNASAARQWLERRYRVFLVIAWTAFTIGLYNFAAGHFNVTSTGQVRTLATVYAAPLFLTIPISLWLYQARRISIPTALLLAAPAAGLFLINSRSAYLAAIVSVVVLGLMRLGPAENQPGVQWRRLGGLASVALCFGTIAVLATPEGRSGIARFSTITSGADPNIRDRVIRTRGALPTGPEGWLIGRGVGLVKTTLNSDASSKLATDPHQTHNSFATALNLGGLIGFVLLVIPVGMTLKRSISRRSDPLIQLLMMMVVFALVLASFNVVLENAYFGIWLWAPLATLYILLFQEPTKGRNQFTPPATLARKASSP